MNRKNFKNRWGVKAALTLLLLIMNIVPAWADADFIIHSESDWNTFASKVNNGTDSYQGKTVELDADITVSTMVGNSSHKFKGTFQGGGHTLTLNNLSYNNSDGFCAPFRYVDGAAIVFLHTAGIVTAGSNTSSNRDKFRAGLIGNSVGTVTIEKCRSSVTINSSINGDGTHGGFVGVMDGGTIDMTDCLFDGKMLGANTHSCGGFVGWRSNGLLNIKSCVFAPEELTFSASNSSTFSRNEATLTNCFYTNAFGNTSGATAIGTMSNNDLLSALGSGWEIRDGKVVPCIVPSPTDLAATMSITAEAQTATVSWTGSADKYNIDINGNVTSNVTSPYTFDVVISTTYSVKVQADYGNGSISQWTSPICFSTPSSIPQHIIEYTLIDSYGDGWNGASINVIDNRGDVVESLTLDNGSSTIGTFSLSGYNYEIIWNKGSYDQECSWSFSENGNELFSGTGSSSMKTGDVLYTIGTITQRPTNLTAGIPDSHSVELNWKENGEATTWQICVNDDLDNLIDVSENPYTLTGLTPKTNYSVKVRAYINDTTQSRWSDPITFTTDIAPLPKNLATSELTLHSATISWTGDTRATSHNLRYKAKKGFYYDFETADPWAVDAFAPCTTFDGDGKATYGISNSTFTNQKYTGACIAFQGDWSTNHPAHGGNAFGAMFNPNDKSTADDWFILPELTIQEGDVFSFWAKELTEQYGAEQIKVGVYGDTPGTFASYLAGSETETLAISSSTWEQYSYDLSAYVGQNIRLAINCVSTDVFAFYFDDIFVGNPNWIIITDVTSPYVLDGLTFDTDYEVQLQSIYPEGVSDWTESIDFTTPSMHPAPNNLTAESPDTHSVELHWTEMGTATAWQICVNEDMNHLIDVTENPYTLAGLTFGKDYSVKVRAYIDASTQSRWSAPTTFTTALPELTATGITHNAATLTWTSFQDHYNVRYRTTERYEPNWEDDFENGLTNWTLYTEGEGTGWQIKSSSNSHKAHSGSNMAGSWSWSNQAYHADNWLVSPKINLQGVLVFWVYTHPQYPDSYEVELSTTGNTVADFNSASAVTLQAMAKAPATGNWEQVIIDLSAYAGQQGHIAIHHVDYDGYYLLIDDFCIYNHFDAGEWQMATTDETTLDVKGLTIGTPYEWQVQGFSDTFGTTAWTKTETFTTSMYFELANNADNNVAIDQTSDEGNVVNVRLSDRTLYRNGDWNTLVLPFNVDDFTGTPLEGATAKTLGSSTYSDGTLTMNFIDATSIEAGKPYIVKWDIDADFIIRTTADWDTFASNVKNGTDSYQGKIVKLAADISVSNMAGDKNHKFQGTFDGRGHTLTFNCTTTDKYCAPFCYIDGATIKNLRVAGTINTSSKFASGIAGYSDNDCTIENCHSSITISSTTSGDGTHGGFVAFIQSGTLTLRNCLFDGKLLGKKTTYSSGFVGWRKAGDIVYNSCLFAPAECTMSTSNSCTFNRNGGSSFSQAYYTQAFGEAQGTAVGSRSIDELANELGDGWELKGDSVVPKMKGSVNDIVNPIFTNVTISNTIANVTTDYVDFIGSYAPFEDDALLLDAFNPDGDAMHAAIRVNDNSAPIGYILAKCYTDAAKTKPSTFIPFTEDGSVTLYPEWEVIHYSITYNLDGGSMTSAYPTTYTIEDKGITLVNPTRDGYTFVGWIGTDLDEPTMTVTISTGSTGDRTYTATWIESVLTLTDQNDNATVIQEAACNKTHIVTLANYTLYRNGDWNTLCLPFDLNEFKGTPLEGATVKTLKSSTYSDGTLTMDFADATSIEAGKPYIVKWTSAALAEFEADFIIRSEADWNAFADNVVNYKGKVVKLAADITVSKMVSGTFKGTFDGCGHTLTFNYTATGLRCALFEYINDATIRNLRIAGTLTSSARKIYLGGIAVNSQGNSTIENCRNSITISSTKSEREAISGFVDIVHSGTLTFQNCLFDGKLLCSSTINNGAGFVGSKLWSDIVYNDCLFAPTECSTGNSKCYTFTYGSSSPLSRAYYTRKFGKAQGTAVGSKSNAELLSLLGNGWELKGNSVVPKMQSTASNIINPLFTGVTISNVTANVETDYVDFVGSYAPFEDDALLLDAHNLKGKAMHAAISPKVTKPGYTFQGWYTDAARTTPVTTIPFAEDGSVTLYAQWKENAILLADTEDNAAMLEALDKSKTYNVTLVNRLIDTEWNTLALPFDVTAEQLEQTFGAEVRLFELAGSSLEDKVLGLSFKRAESIEAGKPYFIAAAEDVREPKFQGVTIDAEANVPTETDYVDFVPTLGATQIFGYGGSAEEPGSVWSVLILGGGNTLYNPASLENAWMRGYRGYFQIHDKEGNADESLAAQFRLTFDDSQEVTGIVQVENSKLQVECSDATYNLMGQKVNNPGKGMFVTRGKKVIVR